MRVQQLIEELQKLPPTATVWVVDGKGSTWVTPTELKVITKKPLTSNDATVDVYLSDGT